MECVPKETMDKLRDREEYKDRTRWLTEKIAKAEEPKKLNEHKMELAVRTIWNTKTSVRSS